jgi:hypothetical protein
VLRDEPPPGRKLALLPSVGILVRDCGTSKSEAHIRFLHGTGRGRAKKYWRSGIQGLLANRCGLSLPGKAMRKLLQLDSAQVGVGFRQSYFGVYIDDYVVAPVGHFRGGPKLGVTGHPRNTLYTSTCFHRLSN